jgi:hypothetical protein
VFKIFRHPSAAAENFITRVRERSLKIPQKTQKSVARMIEEVRRGGDQALLKFTRQFDAPDMTHAQLKVSSHEFKAAAKQLDRKFTRALNRAIDQISSFHRAQRQRSWIQTERPGVVLGQLVHAVQRAGILCARRHGRHDAPGVIGIDGCLAGQDRRGRGSDHGQPAPSGRQPRSASAGGGPKSRCGRGLQNRQRLGHRRLGIRNGRPFRGWMSWSGRATSM